jgi:hypothetical protein
MMRSSLVVCVALCIAGMTGSAAEAASDPEHVPLRLSDLAAGYQVGDDSGCALDLVDEDTPRVLIELARNHSPRICAMEFERLWVEPGRPPGPALIESTVSAFDDVAGAEAGFEARRELLAYLTGQSRGSFDPRPAPAPMGDAVAVFSTDDALVRGRVNRPGVAVMWRTGALLSSIFVAGRVETAGEEQALALARTQQGRIEAPTPLSPQENDDRLVPLDNPRLGVPVYWLGERFDPPGALPALTVGDTSGPIGRFGGPGWRARIDYSGSGPGGVMLGLWTTRAFERYKRSRIGRLVRPQRCGSFERVDMPFGRGVVKARYERPPKRCGRRAPDRYFAVLRVDGAVVTVNVPFCLLCRPQPGDPYNTQAGVRAVLQALQPRPRSSRGAPGRRRRGPR